MKRTIIALGLAILCLVSIIGLTACTPADLQALQGTLKNVDNVTGNVTLNLKDGTAQTFNFTNVKVDTIKQALGNATLEVGDQVTVKAHKNGEIEEVDVENAEVHGAIKSLGADNATITTLKQGDITLRVTADTKIRMQDKGTAAFSDLKVGQSVETKYDVTTKTALRVNIGGAEANNGQIQGAVKAVDPTLKTVTISTKGKADVTIKITSSTAIRIEDKRTAAFSDIKVGDKIEASYEKGSLNALKIAVQGREGKNQHDD
jgi:Cu/Ag efflux protein CusF